MYTISFRTVFLSLTLLSLSSSLNSLSGLPISALSSSYSLLPWWQRKCSETASVRCVLRSNLGDHIGHAIFGSHGDSSSLLIRMVPVVLAIGLISNGTHTNKDTSNYCGIHHQCWMEQSGHLGFQRVEESKRLHGGKAITTVWDSVNNHYCKTATCIITHSCDWAWIMFGINTCILH